MFMFNSPQEAMEHERMTRESHIHEVQGFLNELSASQLETMKMLVFSFADPESGAILAAQHHGMILAMLSMRHNKCACGGDHESAEDLLKQERLDDVDSPHPNGTGETYSEPGPLQVPRRSGADLLEEYNLEIRPGDGALVCKGCGLWYVSLADRMIKGPDDCHGCHMKSAQG